MILKEQTGRNCVGTPKPKQTKTEITKKYTRKDRDVKISVYFVGNIIPLLL